METVWNCPLCNSSTEHHHFFQRVIGKLWVRNYVPVMVFYAICDQCGMVFQWQHMDEDEMYKYYAGQYRATIQGGNDDVTERVIAEQTRRVEYLMPELEFESVRNLLDIGASTGLFMEAMKEKYGCEVMGIEPGEKFRIYMMNKKKLKALSDIDIMHHEYKEHFDLITMIHVLEHLSDPAGMLVRLHDYITADGRLVIEVPNMYHEFNLSLSHPLVFSEETLAEMLSRTGWEIEWKKTYAGFKVGRPSPSNILVCAKPGKVAENKLDVDIDGIKRKFVQDQNALMAWIQEHSK